VFQTLSVGKTWQLVLGTGAAAAAIVPGTVAMSDDDARIAMPRRVVRIHIRVRRLPLGQATTTALPVNDEISQDPAGYGNRRRLHPPLNLAASWVV
jgi:hypothetical protein